jgi:hypothetical protein
MALLKRRSHPLRFPPHLSEPWQFEALRSRTSTELEIQLVRFTDDLADA